MRVYVIVCLRACVRGGASEDLELFSHDVHNNARPEQTRDTTQNRCGISSSIISSLFDILCISGQVI